MSGDKNANITSFNPLQGLIEVLEEEEAQHHRRSGGLLSKRMGILGPRLLPVALVTSMSEFWAGAVTHTSWWGFLPFRFFLHYESPNRLVRESLLGLHQIMGGGLEG